MQAPDFTLPDQNGSLHSLNDYRGKWLLLYFYPKDDTPGCTKEACSFRDSSQEFEKAGLSVVGVSKDSVSSHGKFAKKYDLTFTILSDVDTEVIQAYGAWGTKKFMGKEFEGTSRNSYLINPKGEIVKSYLNVNPLTHYQEILHDFKDLS